VEQLQRENEALPAALAQLQESRLQNSELKSALQELEELKESQAALLASHQVPGGRKATTR
jgi:hypothetical protein